MGLYYLNRALWHGTIETDRHTVLIIAFSTNASPQLFSLVLMHIMQCEVQTCHYLEL